MTVLAISAGRIRWRSSEFRLQAAQNRVNAELPMDETSRVRSVVGGESTGLTAQDTTQERSCTQSKPSDDRRCGEREGGGEARGVGRAQRLPSIPIWVGGHSPPYEIDGNDIARLRLLPAFPGHRDTSAAPREFRITLTADAGRNRPIWPESRGLFWEARGPAREQDRKGRFPTLPPVLPGPHVAVRRRHAGESSSHGRTFRTPFPSDLLPFALNLLP